MAEGMEPDLAELVRFRWVLEVHGPWPAVEQRLFACLRCGECRGRSLSLTDIRAGRVLWGRCPRLFTPCV